jgi:hypothetical protein
MNFSSTAHATLYIIFCAIILALIISASAMKFAYIMYCRRYNHSLDNFNEEDFEKYIIDEEFKPNMDKITTKQHDCIKNFLKYFHALTKSENIKIIDLVYENIVFAKQNMAIFDINFNKYIFQTVCKNCRHIQKEF